MSRPPLHRRSLRLRGHNYAAPAVYVVTICVNKKACLLGRVVDGHERHNPAGRMVARRWREIESRYPHVRPQALVVMPNHIHGILRWLEPHACGGEPIAERATLGDVLAWFKSRTTNDYSQGVEKRGWPRFDRRFWQRNYYEHILRDWEAIARAEYYIYLNPAMWKVDPYNPMREEG